MAQCIFCQIIAGTIPASIIAQTDSLIVIKDINPQAPIHYLILTKHHVQDIQSLEKQDHQLAGDIVMMARELSGQLPGSGDFKLVINSGSKAGQQVLHLHAHFLSGASIQAV